MLVVTDVVEGCCLGGGSSVLLRVEFDSVEELYYTQHNSGIQTQLLRMYMHIF